MDSPRSWSPKFYRDFVSFFLLVFQCYHAVAYLLQSLHSPLENSIFIVSDTVFEEAEYSSEVLLVGYRSHGGRRHTKLGHVQKLRRRGENGIASTGNAEGVSLKRKQAVKLPKLETLTNHIFLKVWVE